LEQFTYVKRGYDPEEVDKYIGTLEQVIKSYKEKDNAIKNAIISAQIAADNMIKNAKNQADEYKGQIAKELDKVTQEVDRQRMRIQAFQDVYTGLVRKYLTDIDDKEMNDLFNRLDDVDNLVKKLKEVDITPSAKPEQPLVPEKKEPQMNFSNSPAPVLNFNTGGPISPAPEGNPFAPMADMQNEAPAPQISLGPATSPSLNKGYAPPQVVAKINDDGNYVPS
jgi:cell division septum initiation protein DivIVA